MRLIKFVLNLCAMIIAISSVAATFYFEKSRSIPAVLYTWTTVVNVGQVCSVTTD